MDRPAPITYAPVPRENADRNARMLVAAINRLSDQNRRRVLTPQEVLYQRALRAFNIGPGRSGQRYGVYTRGIADYTADLDRVASEIIHDSVHAYLWRRATNFNDERLPSEVQAAYLRRIGRPDLARRARDFGADPKAQSDRRNEAY